MRIWVVTDTHFLDKNLIGKGYRPKHYQSRILLHWREKVRPEDMIIHLGDFSMGPSDETKEILGVLPGRMVITIGNHDRSAHWFMEAKKDMFACKTFTYKGVLFSHHPALELPERCYLNIHGHTHGNGHREYNKQPWHYELALENTGYAPVLLKTTLKEKTR